MTTPEQTIQILEAIKPEQPSYWWLLTLAIIPVVVGWYLNRITK